MRIVLIGQAPFGAKVLEGLLEKGEEVVAAYTAPDRGSRLDPFKEAALAKGIAIYQPATFKDDQVFAGYKELKPELTILAFVTDIIPEKFLTEPSHGAICYHPSLLPLHRGASAINWARLNVVMVYIHSYSPENGQTCLCSTRNDRPVYGTSATVQGKKRRMVTNSSERWFSEKFFRDNVSYKSQNC